jgi:hypothetical protein
MTTIIYMIIVILRRVSIGACSMQVRPTEVEGRNDRQAISQGANTQAHSR